uniref:hypothetical protein n=1 Tax=uncultured Marinobacter sp. TaxID=187379 RepID=UPI0025972BC2
DYVRPKASDGSTLIPPVATGDSIVEDLLFIAEQPKEGSDALPAPDYESEMTDEPVPETTHVYDDGPIALDVLEPDSDGFAGEEVPSDLAESAVFMRAKLEKARWDMMWREGIITGARNARGRLVDIHGTEVVKSSNRPAWYGKDEWDAMKPDTQKAEREHWNEYLLNSIDIGEASPDIKAPGGVGASSSSGSALTAKRVKPDQKGVTLSG